MAKPPHLPHDRAVLLLALLAGFPAVAAALYFTWHDHHDVSLQLLITVVLAACWLGLAAATRERVVRPLQTMANLLLALREGDYSFRARAADHGDALGDVLAEINALGDVLQSQRRGTMEMTALLRAVMERIDVAIFAFDQDRALRLVNPAGERLLAEPAERLLGRTAEAAGLADCLQGEPQRLLPAGAFPAAEGGRWGLRRSAFREDGRPHQLLVIANLTQPLREEELKAWQGLVRVLGHELNNSLAPIKSIAGSLGSALRRHPRPPDWEDDLRSGLDVIAARAESLARFLQAYSRLARLPAPALAPCDLASLVARVAALEGRIPVEVRGGPALPLRCDAAQVEQVLINLIKNAAEAALEARPSGRPDAGVRVSWTRRGTLAEIRIEDDGPGLAQTANLFVPFFTTKPEGSGIGLVLCRQIAENHGGDLELSNRRDATGCLARLRLPMGAARSP
ncbi:MAG TPA: ATP-binding protein [Opitutaceae bacterium]|nr:ATP-binding protein [Opitutaceae bacterium]